MPSRGFAFTYHGTESAPFCSMECSEIFMDSFKNNRAINPQEDAAIEAGGSAAGMYLDSIGKFNLSDLSQEEWREFCTTLFHETCQDLRRQARLDVPS